MRFALLAAALGAAAAAADEPKLPVAVDSVKQPFSGLAELVIEWSWLTWTNSNRI